MNLIEIIKEMENQTVFYKTSIPIYHPDGTYLAKVKGSRIFMTDDGEKAGLKLEHPSNMTVCKLGKNTLFEVKYLGAAAVNLNAELWTPKGFLVKANNESLKKLQLFDASSKELRLGGIAMSGNSFNNLSVGIHMKSDGSILIGCM